MIQAIENRWGFAECSVCYISWVASDDKKEKKKNVHANQHKYIQQIQIGSRSEPIGRCVEGVVGSMHFGALFTGMGRDDKSEWGGLLCG